jgi:hypothetical protein
MYVGVTMILPLSAHIEALGCARVTLQIGSAHAECARGA